MYNKWSAAEQRLCVQKLAASLADKGLSPETGISASDEDEYGTSLATFLQYGSALSVIDQLSTHAYQGRIQSDFDSDRTLLLQACSVSCHCRLNMLG